jgi:Protein of unknown function (DUF2795)
MDMNMMQQQMQGMNFPASKQDVMNWAMQHGASNDQMEMIKKMPMDNFNSMDDVMAAAKSTMKMG